MSRRPLKPANPIDSDPGARPAYLPRPPWMFVGVAVLLCGVVAALGMQKRAQARETLRERVLSARARTVGELPERFDSLVAGLRLVRQGVGQPAAAPYRRDGFSLESLRGQAGLYFRVDDGSLAPGDDVVAACLGLQATNLEGTLGKAAFLSQDWVEELQATDDLMRLRTMEVALARHLREDLPLAREMLQARWVMAVVERPDDRRDLSIWALPSGQLQVRVQSAAQGRLLSARIAGAPPTARFDLAAQGHLARDCALARNVKRVL